MTNKKYTQYTMNQLRGMVERKYEKLLNNTEKEVFVVAIDDYYGMHYGAFSKYTLDDFYRSELEDVLSSKFSPSRIIEMENIIVIHDGNAKQIKTENGPGVWTGRIKKDGSKEVLLDEGYGRWTWIDDESRPSWHSERIRMNDIVKSFVNEIAQTGAMSFDTAKKAVFKYYKNFLESGNSYSWNRLLHIKECAIVVGFEDNPEGMNVFSSKRPKLFIYKMNDKMKGETLSKIEKLKRILESKEERILLREMAHYIGDFSYMPFFYFSKREVDNGGAEFGYHFNLWFDDHRFEDKYKKILDLLGFKVDYEMYDREWVVYGVPTK